jgi:CDP-glucose 4,6-dehydratase
MDAGFWKSRRVFLTGHTGFKGSWLALWLQALGAEVCGYSLEPPTEPNLYSLLGLEGRIGSVRGDIRDLESLATAMANFAPEVVLHMAAQPLVRLSYEQPVETYSVNVLGTVHLLEAVRRSHSVRSVVVVTSDKCYENREWQQPYQEHEAMGGHDPYSSSKGCAELVTSAYRRSFFHPESWPGHQVGVASARAGNVIGGGDWAPDRLVPDIMRAWAAGEAVMIRNPEAVRPWQHVLEPLSGYLLLAERLYADGPAYSESWNFGPAEADEHPVRYLVEKMAGLWNGGGNAEGNAEGSTGSKAGGGVRWEFDTAEHVHEANLLRLNSAKACARLGWSPRWGLDETLVQTVEWYKDFYGGRDMRERSLLQIEAFMQPAQLSQAPISPQHANSGRAGDPFGSA